MLVLVVQASCSPTAPQPGQPSATNPESIPTSTDPFDKLKSAADAGDVAGEAATVTERLFAFFSPKRFPALVTKYINGDIHEQYGVSCGRPRIFL